MRSCQVRKQPRVALARQRRHRPTNVGEHRQCGFRQQHGNIVVVLKLALLAIVIAAGSAGMSASRLSPHQWSDPLSLVVSGMVIFVAYEGFELIANAAEDVRDPRTTLPRAFYTAVGVVVVLYVVIAAITVSAVPESQIETKKDYALAVAAEPSLGHAGFVLVAVAAVLATLSAINATVYGNARSVTSLRSTESCHAPKARSVEGSPYTVR